MKVAFCTLGCKVNQYDTQAMTELFEKAGYDIVDFDDAADIYVINTCTVTQTGDKKSRQMISRAHAKSNDAYIIVTGCYSQHAPDEVLSLPGVDLVIGNKERLKIVELFEALAHDRKKTNAVFNLEQGLQFEELLSTHESRTRAHLKIQEGCDRFCTYCVIPYARGPIRSRPLESVRDEFVRLNDAGYAEIVLTGIHLMSYGRDLDESVDLRNAIQMADGLDAIKRIRLGSLEPQMLSDEFVSNIAKNNRICGQFHLSLQSGSDTVLKRMGRRYTTEEYRKCVNKLREAMPGCAITTDIIVGFPAESENEFCETLSFTEEIGLARIHVFPYSRRVGTKAYDMPNQISRRVKTERAARLIELGNRLESRYIGSFIGKQCDVLFEEVKNGCLSGYTSEYVRVNIESEDPTIEGKIISCRIVSADNDHLIGEL